MKMKFKNNEAGVIIPLFALLIVAIVIVVAMQIDNSRLNLSVNTIQDAADAASRTGVRQFDGSIPGWENSKKAALLALASNSISGVSEGALEGIVLDQAGPLGENTLGKANGVTVQVARGIYWFDEALNDGEGGRKFISLENFESGVGSEIGPLNEEGPWKQRDFDSYALANALKVSVSLGELEASGFGKKYAGDSRKDLQRESIAISDSRLERPVAPFAIPYCQLMLNTDPNEKNDHVLDYFNYRTQEGREFFFTELAGFVTGNSSHGTPTASLARREGIRRYLSHVNIPVAYFDGDGPKLCRNTNEEGYDVNCKAIPVQGIIGIPGPSKSYVSVSEFMQALKDSSENTLRVGAGEHFRALKEWGTVTAEVHQAMEAFMKTAGTRFKVRDIFMINEGTELDPRWYARPNFPAVKYSQQPNIFDIGSQVFGDSDFLRRPHPSQYIGSTPGSPWDRTATILMPWKWDGWDDNANVQFGFVQGGTEPAGTFPFTGGVPITNPLCNTAEGGPGRMLNSPDYEVTRVDVMVIAPSSDIGSNGKATYCDFDALFSGDVQDSVVPVFDNDPRVVGKVRMDFVSYNFEDLDAKFAPSRTFPGGMVTPNYDDGQTEIIDQNTTRADLGLNQFDNIKKFEAEYNECIESRDAGDPQACDNGVEYGGAISFPSEYEDCFDLSSMQGLADQLKDLSSNTECCSCRSTGLLGLSETCDCDEECVTSQRSQARALLDQMQNNSVWAKANAHCLPLPNEDASNFNDPNHYEEMAPRHAGRGCGGVRAKVSNTGEESVIIHSGMKWKDMRPVIVEDGALLR